jgi:hypothetical protein
MLRRQTWLRPREPPIDHESRRAQAYDAAQILAAVPSNQECSIGSYSCSLPCFGKDR